MSAMIMEEHGGMVPEDINALELLPGVGHKTASVVVAQAFGSVWMLVWMLVGNMILHQVLFIPPYTYLHTHNMSTSAHLSQ